MAAINSVDCYTHSKYLKNKVNSCSKYFYYKKIVTLDNCVVAIGVILTVAIAFFASTYMLPINTYPASLHSAIFYLQGLNPYGFNAVFSTNCVLALATIFYAYFKRGHSLLKLKSEKDLIETAIAINAFSDTLLLDGSRALLFTNGNKQEKISFFNHFRTPQQILNNFEK